MPRSEARLWRGTFLLQQSLKEGSWYVHAHYFTTLQRIDEARSHQCVEGYGWCRTFFFGYILLLGPAVNAPTGFNLPASFSFKE